MDNNVVRLRERAEHLMALAVRARGYGQIAISEEFTQLATETLDRAADVEHGGISETIRRGIG